MENYVFLGLYFVLIISVGLLFRRFNTNISNYFRGDGQVLWWIVGISAFVSQFSAQSLTANAGKAYLNGALVLFTYLGNGIAFLLAAAYFAPRYRQLDISTPMQAVRMRYGKYNELLIAILSIPSFLIFPAIWLNATAFFMAPVINLGMGDQNLQYWIIILGLIVVLMTLWGGSWAVYMSDVLQFFLMLSIGIYAAVAALSAVGGPVALVQNFRGGNFLRGNSSSSVIVSSLWVFVIVLQKMLNHNNMINSVRVLGASDGRAARKATLLTALIFFLCPLIWFIPAWASAILFPDLASLYPEMGARATNAAYLVFVDKMLPAGALGLFAGMVFSATMSSLDSSYNWVSGFFTVNIYKTVIKPKANEQQTLRVAKWATFLSGISVIVMGLYINTLWKTSLFDLTVDILGYIWLPILIPCFFGIFIRKTPDWAVSATLLVGGVLSFLISQYLSPQLVSTVIGGGEWSKQEWREIKTIITYSAHFIITFGFFASTRLLFRGYSVERQREIQTFFTRWHTPLRQYHPVYISQQRRLIGWLTIGLGGILSLAIFSVKSASLVVLIIISVILIAFGIYSVLLSHREGTQVKST